MRWTVSVMSMPFYFAENILDHALEHVQDVLLLYEAHLAVDLCKFRLAVGPEVFVPEALYDLEVPVVPAHHQELFKGLGRLGKGVKLTRVHPGRNHEVPRPFRSGFDQERGLNVHELLFVQIVPGCPVHGVAQFQVFPDRTPAQVQVAVLHTQVLAPVCLILDGEGGYCGLIEDAKSPYGTRYVSGGQVGVLIGALDDRPSAWMTYSRPRGCSSNWGWRDSLKTNWVMPYRSLRSTKVMAPNFRMVCTHPDRVTPGA